MGRRKSSGLLGLITAPFIIVDKIGREVKSMARPRNGRHGSASIAKRKRTMRKKKKLFKWL